MYVFVISQPQPYQAWIFATLMKDFGLRISIFFRIKSPRVTKPEKQYAYNHLAVIKDVGLGIIRVLLNDIKWKKLNKNKWNVFKT